MIIQIVMLTASAILLIIGITTFVTFFAVRSFLESNDWSLYTQQKRVRCKCNDFNDALSSKSCSSSANCQLRLRRFWCWLFTGHTWDKTGSNRTMSREMNRCNNCDLYEPGPD
jgi:hypothetical protein